MTVTCASCTDQEIIEEIAKEEINKEEIAKEENDKEATIKKKPNHIKKLLK